MALPCASRALVALCCCVVLGVQAAPNHSRSQDNTPPDLPQNLLIHLEQVHQTLSDQASALVGTAMGFLGVPYRRGGNNASTGFDCSGFVRAMYEQTVGLVLPRSASQQAAATETINPNELKPGDLVFYNTMRRAFSHVGIYIGDGKFVHSPRVGGEVRVDNMDQAYWKRRFNGARRVQPSDGG